MGWPSWTPEWILRVEDVSSSPGTMRPGRPRAYVLGVGTGSMGGQGPASRRLRASDRDRADTVAVLRQATADGYLTLLEFEDRLDAAFAARFIDELDALVGDLPRLLRAPAAGRPGTTRGQSWIPAVIPRIGRVCLGILAAMLILAAVANFWIPLTIMSFLWWRRNRHRGIRSPFCCVRRRSLEYI